MGGAMAPASVMGGLVSPRPTLPSRKSQIHVVRKPPLVCCSAPSSPSPSRRNAAEGVQQRRIDGKGLRRAAARSLVKFSTSDGRWDDKWTERYVFTLRELGLSDLVQDAEYNEAVSVDLSVQKHAGFGFSIEGRIVTSLTWKCSSCFTPFRKDPQRGIQASRDRRKRSIFKPLNHLNAVVYVKPGSEAVLDQLIQDTLRLTATMKDTCSKACEKATPRWQYVDGKVIGDQMWSGLYEMKESFRMK